MPSKMALYTVHRATTKPSKNGVVRGGAAAARARGARGCARPAATLHVGLVGARWARAADRQRVLWQRQPAETVALYYGSWLTQDAIRGTSGGHNGKHALLLGVNGATSVMSACAALKLNCSSSWDFNEEPQPQSNRFLSWASAAIDAGKPVIMGVYWAEESDADYDHIVPMVGYTDNAVYFNDLHSNSTTRAELPGFVSNRKHCKRGSAATLPQLGGESGTAESWKFCLPREVDYGVIVEGNSDAQRAGLLPLRLDMVASSEPDYSKEDREHQVPVLLTATLRAMGLTAGGRYVLLRYETPAAIPAEKLLARGGYSEHTAFTPSGSSQSWPVSFMSNSTTLFRCVRAS
jgi:hypothetical protein